MGMNFTHAMGVLGLGTLIVFACSAPRPLSITLYDPKTSAVRNCAARESRSEEISVLSAAVEACARALEARGYIRKPDSTQ
jgi:hypothetical protein